MWLWIVLRVSTNGVWFCFFFVIDRLGPLWPVIGIIVEALVLFLIIFIAEKRKKDKEKGLWNSIYYEYPKGASMYFN